MKRIYHLIKAKYYNWQVKRYYKRLLNEMPLHEFVFVDEHGNLIFEYAENDLYLVTGTCMSKHNWPTISGVRIDYEETA